MRRFVEDCIPVLVLVMRCRDTRKEMSERRLDATHLLTEFPACCFNATLNIPIQFSVVISVIPPLLPPPAEPTLTSPMSCLRTLDDGRFLSSL